MTTAVAARTGTGALTVPAEGEFQYLPLSALEESPLNTRKRFDQAALEDLAQNIKKAGVVDPLTVRPIAGGKYEIASGHRRFRAAKIAGLTTVPARVRPMEDTLFLEVLTIANLQRSDLHPLEEARGFAALMKKGIGYDVKKIAERVGRSIEYVYARLKLLQLTPAVMELFEEDKITAGHAIELARLSHDDQERAIKFRAPGSYGEDGGLWRRPDGGDDLFGADAPALDGEPLTPHLEKKMAVVPVSVRELRAWIDGHVRFNRAEPDPTFFPETATAVKVATEKAEKVVAITTKHQLASDLKDPDEKTYVAGSWKRADGKTWRDPSKYSPRDEKSKTCDRSVLGVITIGDGRSDSFRVCVSKTCPVHFPQEARKKKSAATSGSSQKREAAERAERAREEAARAKQEREAKAYRDATPALLKAVADKIKSLSATTTGPLGKLLLKGVSTKGGNLVALGKSAEDLVRYLAFREMARLSGDNWWAREFLASCATLGIDTKKIIAAAAEPEKATAPAKTKKPAKKARK